MAASSRSEAGALLAAEDLVAGYLPEVSILHGCTLTLADGEQAKTSCIISRALGGVGQINLSATLAS